MVENMINWPAMTSTMPHNVSSSPAVLNHYNNQVWSTGIRRNSNHIPDEPKRAACCFIQREDGKILGVTRKDDYNAWGLPGGKVDPGETPEQTAIRELHEETGLRAIALKPILTWMPPNQEDETDTRASDGYETTTYLTDVENFNICASEEGRVGWITWTELLNGPFGLYNRNLMNKLTK